MSRRQANKNGAMNPGRGGCREARGGGVVWRTGRVERLPLEAALAGANIESKTLVSAY